MRYPEAIEKRWPRRWISKVVVQALPRDEVRRLHDAGVQIYHPNYEVWDKNLFEALCAGKARYIGREQWIRRILDAADVFGPKHVIPNFVAGIEMAGPTGFATVDEAIAKNDIVAASVLSGNRNFEARVHQSIKANFLMSPPLVVAFALAVGTVSGAYSSIGVAAPLYAMWKETEPKYKALAKKFANA